MDGSIILIVDLINQPTFPMLHQVRGLQPQQASPTQAPTRAPTASPSDPTQTIINTTASTGPPSPFPTPVPPPPVPTSAPTMLVTKSPTPLPTPPPPTYVSMVIALTLNFPAGPGNVTWRNFGQSVPAQNAIKVLTACLCLLVLLLRGGRG